MSCVTQRDAAIMRPGEMKSFIHKCVSPVDLNLHRPTPEAWLLVLSVCVRACVFAGSRVMWVIFGRDLLFARPGSVMRCHVFTPPPDKVLPSRLPGDAVWHHSDDPRPVRVVSEAKVTCCPRRPSVPETMTHSTHSWCFYSLFSNYLKADYNLRAVF